MASRSMAKVLRLPKRDERLVRMERCRSYVLVEAVRLEYEYVKGEMQLQTSGEFGELAKNTVACDQ